MKKLLFTLFILITHTSRGQYWNIKPSTINDALLQNSITGIQKDDKGFLWISTQFGIYKYDGKNVNPYIAGNKQNIESNRFSYILKQNKSQELITLDEKKEYYIKNGGITPLSSNPDKICVTNNNIFFYIAAHQLKPWILNETRLGSTITLFINGDTLIQYNKQFINVNKQVLVSTSFTDKLAQDGVVNIEKNNLIINNTGIHKISLIQNKLQSNLLFKLKGKKTYLQKDKEFFWFENDNQIIKFDCKKNTIVYKIDLQQTDIKIVTTLFEAKDQLYIGTATQGIYETPLFKGHIYKTNFTSNAENILYSYSYDSVSNKYYSINAKGLYVTSNIKEGIRKLYNGNLEAASLIQYKNNLLFCNTKNEIIEYQISRNKAIVLTQISDFGIQIKKIEQPNDSILFVTTTKQILTFNINKKRIDTIYQIDNNFLITTSALINKKWHIGTENGLHIWDPIQKNTEHLLAAEYVRNILPFDNTTTIIGTYSNGTFVLKNNSTYHLNNDPKFISKAVVCIAKDKDSDLWVICNKGAFIWKKQTILNIQLPNTYNHYYWFLGTGNDLPCTELNGGQTPYFYNKDIIIPSTNGLIILDKMATIHDLQLPEINIDAFMVDNVNRKISITPIDISPRHKEMEIKVSFPLFESDNNFKIYYRLIGLSDDWKPLNNNRNINFNKLPTGHYAVEFKIDDNNNIIKLIEFNVLPFWYQTTWFYISIILILLLLFFGILKVRTAILKRNQVLLKKIIDEKTVQLQNNLKTISASEKEVKRLYKNRNKLYSILMHDLKSPLSFLSNFSTEQFKKQKNNILTDPDTLKTISSTTNDLSKFINEFLFWLQLQNKHPEIKFTKINLTEVLMEVVQLYENICLINNNKIVYFAKIAPIYIYSDADLIKIIFRNLLDNANKYTKDGVIKISCALQDSDNKVVIQIQDSGIGLPDHILSLINHELQKENMDPNINANHKMGIQITREFIQQLKGSIKVSSSKNNGTSFEIIFDTNFKDS